MLKRLIPFSIFVVAVNLLFAQRPTFVPVDMTVIPDASRMACDNKAGTSTQTLSPTAKSNDKKFLCYNDRLFIKHNKDQVLTSDPDLSSAAGVGYLLLTCSPTISGPTIQNIAADACVIKKLPSGSTPQYGFVVSTNGVRTGDNEFYNDGWWQTNYGNNKPYKLVAAPITFDDINNGTVEYEGTPAGQCVHVNTAAAFDLVYLNLIKESIISQGNKAGSFRIGGGYPEYDAAANYNISIVSKTNSTVTGTITSGNIKHNGTVNFTVPQNDTYIVTVKDGKSCDNIFEMVISSVVDFSIKNDTICSGKTGKLTIIPSGGSGNYTYTWQKFPGGAVQGPLTLPTAGATITNLAEGSYSISVQDVSAGTTVGPKLGYVVSANQQLSVTLGQKDPTCPQSKDANVTANVIGGYSPYYYEWSNGQKGFNLINITGLGVINGNSNYAVTVSDRFGCTSTASTNLTINEIKISNQNIIQATCIGARDGQITFSVSGGNPDVSGQYTFQWQKSGSSNILTQKGINGAFTLQDPGIYTVTITDDKGCSITPNAFEIKANRTLSVSKVVVDAKCFGEANGNIKLDVSVTGSGAQAVNFAWSPIPSSSTPTTTNLSTSYDLVGVGKYKVTITDASSCKIVDSVVVQQPSTALSVNITAQKDPTCAGNSANGQISVAGQGGTPPYKFVWSKGNNTTASLNNLIAGTYTVTVTDNNGCTKSQNVTLNAPVGPVIKSITTVDVKCITASNASIKVTATPANTADVLTYKWSNGKTTPEITDLTPGKYSLTITDQKGCAVFRDTAIFSPDSLLLVGTPIVVKPSCPDAKDGSITLNIKGGTAPYSYQILGTGKADTLPNTSFTFQNLGVGTYNINVTDGNNCPALRVREVEITLPPIMTITKTVDKIVSCTYSKDGEATLVVTDGNSPNNIYTVLWNNASDNAIGGLNQPIKIDNLSSGWNKLTITDGRCNLVDSIFIDAPPAILIDTVASVFTPVTCFGGTDGAITVSAKGGFSPYTYIWGHASSGNTTTNLNAGDYLLTITDSKNCIFATTVTVVEPEKLLASVDTVNTDSVSCFGYTDGKITIKYSGGNAGGYAFAWSPNVSTSAVAENLAAGSYSVVVSDAKGCTTSVPPYVIGEPTAVEFMLDTIKPPLCNGYFTEVKIKNAFGGNGSMLGNYTYTIDDGAPVNAKDAILSTTGGKHVVTVFDPNGCAAQQTIDIQEPQAIRVYVGKDVEISLGDSYEINAIVESINPVIKYNWSTSPGAAPVTFTPDCKDRCAQVIKPLVDGSYILQVEDTLGCIGADTILITIDKNRNVFLPNIFSPNVDGTNDFFEVFADPLSVEQINSLKVYNRWGDLMFASPIFKPEDSRSPGNRWNGFFKDQEANIGVYVYTCEVKFIDGVVLTFRGNVTLVR